MTYEETPIKILDIKVNKKLIRENLNKSKLLVTKKKELRKLCGRQNSMHAKYPCLFI